MADQDPHPADLLHPALSLHRGPRPRRASRCSSRSRDAYDRGDRYRTRASVRARARPCARLVRRDHRAGRRPSTIQAPCSSSRSPSRSRRGRSRSLATRWPAVRPRGRAFRGTGHRVRPAGRALLPYLVVPTLLAGGGQHRGAVVIVSGSRCSDSLRSLAAGGFGAGPVRARVRDRRPPGRRASALVSWRSGSRSADGTPASRRRRTSPPGCCGARWRAGSPPASTRSRMASQILASVHEAVEDTQSAVFVRTEGGVLAPLGYRGFRRQAVAAAEGHLVDSAGRVEPRTSTAAGSPTRHRLALRCARRPDDRRRDLGRRCSPRRRCERPDAGPRRAGPAPRHGAGVRRGALARDDGGAPAARPRDPRRRRPGDRRPRLLHRRPPRRGHRRDSAPQLLSLRSEISRVVSELPARSSTCAARSPRPQASAPRSPTTCAPSAPGRGSPCT